jgi:hypothetical protein
MIVIIHLPNTKCESLSDSLPGMNRFVLDTTRLTSFAIPRSLGALDTLSGECYTSLQE